MEYSAVPASFVSTESGSIVGPDPKDKLFVKVSTESFSEALDRNHSVDGKNVIVLCLDDLVKKAKGERSMLSFALKMQDCAELIQQLLCHLMSAGDNTAYYLFQALAYYQSQAEGTNNDDD